MPGEELRPAWSQQFEKNSIQELLASGPLGKVTPEWAWGGSTGKGIRVAVVDDSVFIRKALEKVLTDISGIRHVGSANSGEELLKRLELRRGVQVAQ